MKRLSGLLCAAGSVLGLFAAAAQALPPIIDRVPANAMIVVSTPSLDQLEKSVQSITTTLELPFPGVKNMLMMGGFDAGVDMTKPVAAIVMAPPAEPAGAAAPKKDADPDDPMADDDEEPREEPPIILLIPTGDYKALLTAFKAEAKAGITEFVGPEGDPAFAKDIGGGYAAVANKPGLLDTFDGKAGNAKAYEAMIGKVGNSIGEKADVLMIANMAVVSGVAKTMMADGMEEALEGPMGMMGGDLDPEEIQQTINAFMEQTSGAVLAMDIEPSGVAFEGAAQFKEGSFLAGAFAKPGDAASLTAKLPNQPYLFNIAFDSSQPAWKQMAKSAMGGAQAAAAGEDDAPPNMFIANIEKADGMAASIGFSPAAIFGGGLFVNSMMYTKSSDPAGYVTDTHKSLTDLNGRVVGGSTYTTAYTKAGAKVKDVDVDVWEIKMAVDENDPMAGQVSSMMFGGAGGPNGFIAPVEGGVVTTFSKNPELMAAAMAAASKGTNSMADDAMTKQVAERLPKGRIAESYIGVKSIMESIKPMLAMMGGPAQFDIPESLPPIGAGLGSGESAGHVTLFVPMAVIKTVGAAMKAANEPPAGGPGPAQPGQPAGQPRF